MSVIIDENLEYSLSTIVKSVKVRRMRCYLNNQQLMMFMQSLRTETNLFNFAVKYLEKTYGVKHLKRAFPTKIMDKYVLVTKLMHMFMLAEFGQTRWHVKKTKLYSDNAWNMLVRTLTNFGEYRKQLLQFSHSSELDKENYRKNIYRNNPTNKAWYRKGALNSKYGTKTLNSLSWRENGQVKILDAHHIYLPRLGKINVIGNLKQFHDFDLAMVHLKSRPNGDFELQLVFNFSILRQKPTHKLGADWNMTKNKALHFSNNDQLFLSDDVVNRANNLEIQIGQLHQKFNHFKHYLKPQSEKLRKIANAEHRLYVKRTNLLDEAYLKLAKSALKKCDLLVLERLNFGRMRSNKENPVPGLNHKLALLRPGKFFDIIHWQASISGKTVINVDSYKTSQVEFGTHNCHKHEITDSRGWISPETGKHIDRDLNAANNILAWGLCPSHHYKLVDFPNLDPLYLIDIA